MQIVRCLCFRSGVICQNLIRGKNNVTCASRTLEYDPQKLDQEIFLSLRSADSVAQAPGFSRAILSASHISMDMGITQTGFRVT